MQRHAKGRGEYQTAVTQHLVRVRVRVRVSNGRGEYHNQAAVTQ